MAVAITITDRIPLGHTDYLYLGSVALDNSYPTGGEALDFTAAVGIPGPSKPKYVLPGFPSAGVAFPKWDQANQKLLMVSAVAGTEVANATDLSASVVPLFIVGP